MRARGKETRQAILQAAEAIFAERGYAGARMDDVAAEVGIKRASMVYYFRDKHSLYVALLQDLYGELLEQYRLCLDVGGTARDRILAVGKNDDVKPLIGPKTRVIDLKGRRVVPGFYDSHVHLLGSGLRLGEVALKDA